MSFYLNCEAMPIDTYRMCLDQSDCFVQDATISFMVVILGFILTLLFHLIFSVIKQKGAKK